MKKVLLMGRSNAGKTSMHSVIFANYPARQTTNIGYTVGVDKQICQLMGNLKMNLWDCGGQDIFMENYFNQQKDTIFKDVEVLIYVFDVTTKLADIHEELQSYKLCLETLSELSQEAKVFVLIHKIDRIHDSQQKTIFELKKQKILESTMESQIKAIEFFATSIWDESLYNAWSTIIQYMVPNVVQIQQQLQEFCQCCDADQVVLFEKQTFLIIANYDNQDRGNQYFERVANVLKRFKLSCRKLGVNILDLNVRSKCSSIIKEFNENSFVMIVYSNANILPGSIEYNLNDARKHFKRAVKETQSNQFII